MTCPHCEAETADDSVKCEECGRRVSLSTGAVLGGALGLLVGGYLVSKVAKKGYDFLAAQDWEGINEELKKLAILVNSDFEKLKGNTQRLNRADYLLKYSSYDKIAIDQAAMLTCATAEAGLRALADRNRIPKGEGDNQGMMDLIIKLKDVDAISNEDSRKLKSLVVGVRNRVMHGDLGNHSKDEIQEHVDFVRDFLLRHTLMNKYGF